MRTSDFSVPAYPAEVVQELQSTSGRIRPMLQQLIEEGKSAWPREVWWQFHLMHDACLVSQSLAFASGTDEYKVNEISAPLEEVVVINTSPQIVALVEPLLAELATMRSVVRQLASFAQERDDGSHMQRLIQGLGLQVFQTEQLLAKDVIFAPVSETESRTKAA